MKTILIDKISLTNDWFRAEATKYDILIHNDEPQNNQQIIDRIADAETIVSNYSEITSAIIDACPNLKNIIVPAVGHNWIDSKYARSKNINVINCPTFNSNTVAELALGMMITLSRKILEANIELRTGHWEPQKYIGTELSGKKLFMIGHGNIGKRIIAKCEALGMTTGFADSKTLPEDFDNMLMEADIICIAIPAIPSTFHIIDSRRLDMIKQSSLIVNVGRGNTIDQASLLALLKNGKIKGCAMDVYEDEPMTAKSTINTQIQELVSLPNVLATPHFASYSEEAGLRLNEEILNNILACDQGNPINIVN